MCFELQREGFHDAPSWTPAMIVQNYRKLDRSRTRRLALLTASLTNGMTAALAAVHSGKPEVVSGFINSLTAEIENG